MPTHGSRRANPQPTPEELDAHKTTPLPELPHTTRYTKKEYIPTVTLFPPDLQLELPFPAAANFTVANPSMEYWESSRHHRITLCNIMPWLTGKESWLMVQLADNSRYFQPFRDLARLAVQLLTSEKNVQRIIEQLQRKRIIIKAKVKFGIMIDGIKSRKQEDVEIWVVNPYCIAWTYWALKYAEATGDGDAAGEAIRNIRIPKYKLTVDNLIKENPEIRDSSVHQNPEIRDSEIQSEVLNPENRDSDPPDDARNPENRDAESSTERLNPEIRDSESRNSRQFKATTGTYRDRDDDEYIQSGHHHQRNPVRTPEKISKIGIFPPPVWLQPIAEYVNNQVIRDIAAAGIPEKYGIDAANHGVSAFLSEILLKEKSYGNAVGYIETAAERLYLGKNAAAKMQTKKAEIESHRFLDDYIKRKGVTAKTDDPEYQRELKEGCYQRHGYYPPD